MTSNDENRAKDALKKQAKFGEDIDLDSYHDGKRDIAEMESLEDLPKDTKETMHDSGLTPSGKGRSGNFLLMDNSVVHSAIMGEGVELMPLRQALKVHDWLKDYVWKAVQPDADKYTAETYLAKADGYFIRALPGAKVKMPVQTCLLLKNRNTKQYVHNVLIAEEGSEVEVVTGCATTKGVEKGLHLGISEFYLKKNSKLTFTMVHNWSEFIGVRPRTNILMDEGATFINNYVALKPVKTIQTYPTAHMNGANGICRFNSVAVAHPGSVMDLGSRAILNAPGCKAELISRTITTGGTVIARGQLVGNAPGIKAHLECKGLILNNKGVQIAIPELEARVPDVEMTHEAAVGKIAQDQVEYLMSRGLTEEEAVGMIVRGFLDVGIRGIPDHLKAEIEKILQETDVRGS
ncbi:MAG TPA: SufD family Fe-S cluster assembly protein [Methanomassiliicoccales archaeon]|nr:SufD family Fe-S cluster assembly protein [Methanomassiliicoccales archaeon]HNX47324.1 SufD family Fe-S cluster assembly protein [Methanomassiliicoccales archaeon]HPR98592.1 SufD family Fe-S cluster assembly protein [Methanomassiliicoccales archaeon]